MAVPWSDAFCVSNANFRRAEVIGVVFWEGAQSAWIGVSHTGDNRVFGKVK